MATIGSRVQVHGITAGIAIRGLTSSARREPGEPRDVSLRILFSQLIVMSPNLPMGGYSSFDNALPSWATLNGRPVGECTIFSSGRLSAVAIVALKSAGATPS